MTDYQRWAVAGLTRNDASGRLERWLPGPNYVSLPRGVRADAGTIYYEWWEAEAPPPNTGYRERVAEGLVEEFVELARAPDADVVRFAEKWGALRAWEREEALAEWRLYSERVRLLLALAAAYYNDNTAAALEIWSELLEARCDASLGPWHRSVSERLSEWWHRQNAHGSRCNGHAHANPGGLCGAGRSAGDHLTCAECRSPACWRPRLGPYEVGEVIDELLKQSEVRVRCLWVFDQAEVEFLGDEGVLGEIALQVALIASRGEDLALCAECRAPFIPVKRWKDRRSFCPRCGRRAANKHAQRARRAASRAQGSQ